jgi:hypothetical protein
VQKQRVSNKRQMEVSTSATGVPDIKNAGELRVSPAQMPERMTARVGNGKVRIARAKI